MSQSKEMTLSWFLWVKVWPDFGQGVCSTSWHQCQWVGIRFRVIVTSNCFWGAREAPSEHSGNGPVSKSAILTYNRFWLVYVPSSPIALSSPVLFMVTSWQASMDWNALVALWLCFSFCLASFESSCLQWNTRWWESWRLDGSAESRCFTASMCMTWLSTTIIT